MNDTVLIVLMLALNGLSCGIAYLIGHKVGLRDGYHNARRARLIRKLNANA